MDHQPSPLTLVNSLKSMIVSKSFPSSFLFEFLILFKDVSILLVLANFLSYICRVAHLEMEMLYCPDPTRRGLFGNSPCIHHGSCTQRAAPKA